MCGGQMERTDVTLLLSRGARLEGVALCPPGRCRKGSALSSCSGVAACTSPWHFQVISIDVVK